MILNIKIQQNDSQNEKINRFYEFNVQEKISQENSQYVEAINLWGRRRTISTIILLPNLDLSSLRYLNIGNSNLSPKSCKFISQIVAITLQDLSLSDNKIGDEGVKHFSKGKWPKLSKINLTNNVITEEGLNHFIRIRAPSLKWAQLAQNKLTKSQMSKLTLMKSDILNQFSLQNNIVDERQKFQVQNLYEKRFIGAERSINL